MSKTFHYSGGLEEFILWLSKNAQSLNSKPINIKGEKDNIKVELSLKWTDRVIMKMLNVIQITYLREMEEPYLPD